MSRASATAATTITLGRSSSTQTAVQHYYSISSQPTSVFSVVGFKYEAFPSKLTFQLYALLKLINNPYC